MQPPLKTILITGANGGLGKECARQLALKAGVEKVYLACRNKDKASMAKQSLEKLTGKTCFETLQLDVSNLNSVRETVAWLPQPIDALVMNAGGMGGKIFTNITPEGVTQVFADNVLGHALLLESLLSAKKLTSVALYAGSESARGVPRIGIKRPKLATFSADEYASICNGTYFKKNTPVMAQYGHVKYVAALWMAAAARKNPQVRIVTISPGNTSGTEVTRDFSGLIRFMQANVGQWLLPLMGFMHKVEVGAKRYLDGLYDADRFRSGRFYASKEKKLTGPLVDQATFFSDFSNEDFQDRAYEAVVRFLK